MTTERPRPAERQRVLEVRELGPEPPEQPRQRAGHPRLLEPRRQLDRLDAGRDELGMPRHGREAEVGRGRGQLAQQVRHVRLVAGALPAEHVGVERGSRELLVDRARRGGDLGPRRDRGAARARTRARCRRGSRRRRSGRRRSRRRRRARPSALSAARHDRAAAGERLGDRDPEALVERGVDEAARAAVEARELLVADLAEPARRSRAARRRPSRGAPTTRSSPSTAAAIRAEVLARLERPDREHVVALGARPVGREHVLDGVRHDPDLRRRDAEQLDQLALRELGDGDHAVGGARRRAARRGASRCASSG